MVTAAIHRVVEQRVSSCADAIAIIDGERALTYRDLNLRSNQLARHLMVHGLRRGAHAVVRMPSGADLTIALLAVLKAGGCYTWSDPIDGYGAWPKGISVGMGGTSREARYLSVDVDGVLRGPVLASPNLPVLTRGSDIACILYENEAAAYLPHESVTALCPQVTDASRGWRSDAGALGVWMVLMTGGTIAFGPTVAAAA